MSEQLRNENTDVLQAQLNDLDANTLQQLLQAAIANKSKVLPNTDSVNVDQVVNNGTTEHENAGQNKEGKVEDGKNSDVDGTGIETPDLQSATLSQDKIGTETAAAPDNLVSNANQEPEPLEEPIPASDTAHHGTIPDQTSPVPVQQNGPVSTPLNDNQPSYVDDQQVQSIPKQQPFAFSLPTASNPPSDTSEQDQKRPVMPAAQQNAQSGNDLPYNPVSLPSGQSPMSFEQQSGHVTKPVFTSVTYVAEPLIEDGPVMPNQPLITSDQHPPTTNGMATSNVEHIIPKNSLNPSPAALGHHQPTGFNQHALQQTVQPVKSVVPSNPFSSTAISSVNEDDQKLLVTREIRQPNKHPHDQFNAPFKPPSSAVDQKRQPFITSTVISSTNESQDLSPHDFPSEVPPVLIPLSKVSQYLPEGMVMTKSRTRIPLPLKPVIVLKDQVAVMVFEQNDDVRKECEQQLHMLEEDKEDISTQLTILEQRASDFNQQSSQPFQDRPGENHNQGILYNETPYQAQRGESYINQGQGTAAGMVQGRAHLNQEQQGFSQQQLKEMQEREQQKQQQLLQQKQQQDHQQQYLDLTSQNPQSYDQQRSQPNFSHNSNPFQYHSLQQQNSLASLPETSYQGPPGSQRFLTSTSLTHQPNSMQTPAQQTVPNPQESQPKLNFVPGMKAPVWMSDEDCKNCGNCGTTFSMTRRKHHCRGCGKIFCNDCCNQLAQLPYLGKVEKICVSCTRDIKKAYAERAKRKKEEKRRRSNSQTSIVSRASSVNPSLLYLPAEDPSLPSTSQPVIPENNFNVPQTTSDAYPACKTPEENFNPVYDVGPSVPDVPVQALPPQVGNPSSNVRMQVGKESDFSRPFSQGDRRVENSWKIPPRPAGRTITWTSRDLNMTFEDQKKKFKNLNKVLKTQEGAVIQAATKLAITARKIQVVIKQELHEAWFLCSSGFSSCGEKEIAFALEKRIAEDVFPYEMVKVYRTIYSFIVNRGERFEHGTFLAFTNPLLGSEENAGFLFIDFNKTPKLIQNHSPGKEVLFGILLKRAELPCAKYVPTRLLNALGVQQQCFPSPAISSRDRPSVCGIEPNELFYSTFFALNQFLHYKIPQAMIPDVHILKSGSKVVLELPFAYQTEVISVLDSLLVDESKPVTVPIAGDVVSEASGHFVYSLSQTASARRGFVVLQNSDERIVTRNQYLAFSAILLVLTFGDACNSSTRFGIEVVEDGITVTFSDSQAREIRQAIYQGTNCVMAVGNSPDSKEQFTLRWTSDTCASVLEVPTPVRVVQTPRQPSRGSYPTASYPSVQADAGQTNVVIDRVKTREIEAAIQRKITSGNPQQSVDKLESDVRQACGGCLLTFANRLRSNAEKRLNLTLSLGPGSYKKWSLGPNNQPINLARSLQLALNEVEVPPVRDDIVFVFNVILQRNA